MIQGKIDIAVHSMKDVPTQLPQGIVQGAVLPRANVNDVLVHNGNFNPNENSGVIATSSLRRKAQWLHKYPNYQINDIRGNVNTRLKKLEESSWNGAIFAQAGLERLNLKLEKLETLDWMISAPAQGAMLVVVNSDNDYALNAVSELNDVETEICTYIERQFLRTLEGGCTAPVGALATYDEKQDKIHFKGNLCSVDGKKNLIIEKSVEVSEWKKLGFNCAKEILENGGEAIMNELKK
jgi:hydroxymethylbilane synthase